MLGEVRIKMHSGLQANNAHHATNHWFQIGRWAVLTVAAAVGIVLFMEGQQQPPPQSQAPKIDADFGWKTVHQVVSLPETNLKMVIYCVNVDKHEGLPCGGGRTSTAFLAATLPPWTLQEVRVKVVDLGRQHEEPFIRIVTEIH